MTKSVAISQKDAALWQRYQDQKAASPMLFPTEGAKALGVSELELLLAAPFSHYIGSDCKAVLKQFKDFGEVESIVRNELAVHEKTAAYHNLKLGDKMGIALNVGGLDLRFFMWRWKHMLAVNDLSRDKPSYSIQFFDESGAAIDKVYLRDLSDDAISRWQEMIAEQAKSVSVDSIELEVTDAPKEWQLKTLDDAAQSELEKGWLAMKDVHEFHGLLQKLKVDRASSYAQAPEGMTAQLEMAAVEAMFEKARDIECPIMTFVGNSGLVQIQTGTVKTLKRMGDWFNILDKNHNNFTLHLKDKALAQVWCVKRPTVDGIVTCIEGFDDKGVSIFSVFGQRREGNAELEAWQNITQDLVAKFAINNAVESAKLPKAANA